MMEYMRNGGMPMWVMLISAIATVVFCVFYWLGLLFIYPTLTPSKRSPTGQSQ